MASWKEFLAKYLSYSRTERNGIIILLALLIGIIAFNLLLPYLIKHEKYDLSQFEKEINRFLEIQERAKDSLENLYNRPTYHHAENDGSHLTPFYFDPNDLLASEWEKMGLTEDQIRVIKNYEAKGGEFWKKEDLKKIYSISDEEYAVLEPFIQIQSRQDEKNEMENGFDHINPFPFDPNDMSRADWEKLGLRERLINTLVNYTVKGGRFFSVEDFKKIYGLKEEEFLILEPYIEIPSDTIIYDSLSIEKKEILLLEINSADTLDLQQLYGIGPSYARRIVKYRELLGGYVRPEQLLEVYGMDSSRFAGIQEHIILKTDSVVTININTATIKDLIKHPYIEFYLAKSIITHREKIGTFKNIDDILDANLIYHELYEKIAPYLTINDRGE